jgi:hypothetical protein
LSFAAPLFTVSPGVRGLAFAFLLIFEAICICGEHRWQNEAHQ